ncbi:quinone oxidoreductase [Niveomyces insectorum RCEF 264]|uniref:Quinone oxidoreductase n=1 Tax=Niveomyces insectorum RCEF 264 TaxID=1081102 RepID=A0A167VMD5_9HYPO|nr:quinone oxidoreductase [Niveomyces insectorum RCEF 264]
MKAVQISKFVENLGDLVVSDVPPPTPAAGQVLVRVKAAGVNFVDTLYARGQHQNNRRHVRPPFTLGLEFAGVVVSSSPAPPPSPSSSPPTFQPGDRVYGAVLGAYAELIAVDASQLRLLPAAVPSFAAAAGLAATAPVAYGALVVLAATAGRGVDVVFDPVGAVGASLGCLAHGGRILVAGFAARDAATLEQVAMNRVLLKQATIIGYRYGESLRRDPAENARIWAALAPWIADGSVQPVVYDRAYRGLDAVKTALQDITDRKVWGKAVVLVDDDEAGEADTAKL